MSLAKLKYNVVDRGYETPCWVLCSVKNNHSYGTVYVSPGNGEPAKPERAHRYSYRIAKGPIPPNDQVHHKCHVRACVNPDHLEAVMDVDNARLCKGSKLNMAAAEEMRRLRAEEGMSVRQIADRFGVSHSCTRDVLSGRSWRKKLCSSPRDYKPAIWNPYDGYVQQEDD